MQGKIIGVGFEKTGTTTLGEALKILGYRVKENCPRALIPILKQDYDKILRIIKNHDALEDKPWFMIYKELDQRIPGSKFILTIRDEESWYRSVSKHIGDLRSAQQEWIYGREKGLPKDDKQNAIQVFSNHNREVIKYFKHRPQDLLILDFIKENSWEKLCAFLGKDIPIQPFPHSMKSNFTEQPKFNFRMALQTFRRRIKNNFKIRYIDWKGYW